MSVRGYDGWTPLRLAVICGELDKAKLKQLLSISSVPDLKVAKEIVGVVNKIDPPLVAMWFAKQIQAAQRARTDSLASKVVEALLSGVCYSV